MKPIHPRRHINDEWIAPDESVILDGAGGADILIPKDIQAKEIPAGNIRMENGVRHDPMLNDPDTMRIVKIILEVDLDLVSKHKKKKGEIRRSTEQYGNYNSHKN